MHITLRNLNMVADLDSSSRFLDQFNINK